MPRRVAVSECSGMSEGPTQDPDFYRQLRTELSDGWRWLDRAVVLAYGAAAGLVVVCFTLLSYMAYRFYESLAAEAPAWFMLLWTPALTAGLVWVTLRFFPLAAGSGIPQVIAALDPALDDASRSRLVSLKLSAAKVVLASAALMGGLSVGREGPSVQVAAGVMLHCQRWMRHRQALVTPHILLVAGGAAGIAAAFNAPLAGVVFAIEELSRKFEARYSGVIIAAIVLAGLIGISAFGNAAYFGSIQVQALGWQHLVPSLLVAIVCGLAGGLFAKLLILSLGGQSTDRLSALRRARPVAFAALLGLFIAIIGLVTGGMTAGSGTEAVRRLLGSEPLAAGTEVFGLLKFVTTWLTAWSGVPGGLFAPSLSIGAGLGYDISLLTQGNVNAALVAMGMAGFLAAVTQAPLTAFIIVMEMIDGRPVVLSLMAVAMVSATIARMISRPLYETLAARLLETAIWKQASEAATRATQASAQHAPAPPDPSPAATTATPVPMSPQTPLEGPRP